MLHRIKSSLCALHATPVCQRWHGAVPLEHAQPRLTLIQHKTCHFLAIVSAPVYILKSLRIGYYPRIFDGLSWMATTSFSRWFLPTLSGILLALSFPGPPIQSVAFLYQPLWAHIALLPLMLAVAHGTRRRALHSGWIAGTTFNLICLYWVAYTQGGGPAVVGGTLLLALYLGLFVALWALGVHLVIERWGSTGWIAAPALWTAQEYALSLGELGFPWLLLGHGQAGETHVVQFAALTGVYGVSYWIVLINALLFLLIHAERPARWLWGTALVSAILLPWLHARSVLAEEHPSETLRIALIQPNLSLEEKWGTGGLTRSIERLGQLSHSAVDQRPDLIVWPETALPCYLSLTADCNRRVQALVDTLDTPLLTGASHYDMERQQPYNSAFFLQPNQADMPHYAKMHLVPFGERTPYRDSIPFLREIDWTQLTGDLGPAEFAPGLQRTIFSHERANFAVLICFESVFPDLVRRHVLAGAQLLVNITNDSWFGRSAGPYQHALLNAMRAIENRVAIARSATSGQSLFIDRFGRRYQMSEIFTQAVLVGDVSIAPSGSFYSRHGDLFAQACLLFTALALVVSRMRKRINL